MNPSLAIIAALPREIAGLVSGVRPDRGLRKRGIWLYRLPSAVIVAAGMGAERAVLGVQAALEAAQVDTLVSAGLAGACLAAAPGEVLEASVVMDVKTGEHFTTDAPVPSEYGIVLATASAIVSVQEKACLAADHNAAMVDMEAAAVARMAHARGLHFRAIKGISDAHDFELVSLASFAGKYGGFRTGAFTLHTALRPWTWLKAMELGRNSAKALAGLQKRLRRLLEEAPDASSAR